MHAIFSHFANDQLDFWRDALVALYIVATCGVVAGVILEGKRFSETWQDRGWLILVIALSIETLAGGIIFWVDAEIQTRLGNDVTTLDQKSRMAKETADSALTSAKDANGKLAALSGEIDALGGQVDSVTDEQNGLADRQDDLRASQFTLGRRQYEAGKRLSSVGAETKRAAASLADTERKQVAFEKAMLPRRFLFIAHSTDEPSWKLLMALKQFAGTTAYVQVVPDFEAQVLANDLMLVLRGQGWNTIAVDENTSKLPPVLIPEGVEVFSRDAPSGVAHTTSLAAEALAKALTAGGLGVSEFPVPHFTVPAGQHSPPSTWELRDDPPDNAVFIAVGVRPITDPLALLGVGLWEIPKSKASPANPKK